MLGYQSYALSADYGAEEARLLRSQLPKRFFLPTFSLQAHSEPFVYTNLLQRGDYYELNQGFTLQASYPINRLESSYLFSAGYQLQHQRALSQLDADGTFNGLAVFQGRRDNLFAGFDFDDVLKYPYSVSSEEGRRISLLYRRFDRAIGADQNFAEYMIGPGCAGGQMGIEVVAARSNQGRNCRGTPWRAHTIGRGRWQS